MGTALLILCGLVPLGILIVAAVQAVRTGHSGVWSALALSVLILSAAALLPLAREDEPLPRFDVAERPALHWRWDDPILLARRPAEEPRWR